MVKSMTGYGRKKAENDQREVTVEIKSVNHRYLDLNIKVPRIYSFLEEAVKSAVSSRVSREIGRWMFSSPCSPRMGKT